MTEQFEAFLAERDYSPKSMLIHRQYMRQLQEWLDSRGLTLAKLRPIHYREFLDEMPWSKRTQHNAYYCLRPYIRSKFGKGHPMMRMTVRQPPPTPQRTLSARQVKQLIQGLDTSKLKNVRNLALVSLMLDTGLRASEVCRLEFGDVDPFQRTYHVLGKGNTVRAGRFSELTQERMLLWLELRPAIAVEGAYTFFVSVGGTKPGTPLSVSGLNLIFRIMGKEAGLGLISPHDLRRTFCTLALLNGAPTRVVQIAGGWKHLSEVERYSQAIEAKHFEPYFPSMQIED